MPRQIVSGERATLAVLDVNGRLTPGVTVRFSNGERLKTDATGRARFVASLNPGILFASIEGRPGRVPMVVLSRAEAGTPAIEVTSAPRIASTTDRFEISGHGFCGDADANEVTIGNEPALVLASSPATLVVLPPTEIAPGQLPVRVSCAKNEAISFSMMLVGLELEADSAALGPGDVRQLTVRVKGTTTKVALEARNLAPEIAELRGGNPMRQASSGGADNTARFEVVGRQKGSFLVSIRLLPSIGKPRS
ncbi:MAG TPA: IPT/TIG domain-containing protein [Candidatus Saccharimonadales bacterium]|nr:IPT/TIG domain-containing protein [Candidatus Saccharimonadales bacterium]